MPILGTSPEAIDLAEDRGAVRPGARRGRPARAQARHGLQRRRGGRRSPRRSATRCSCARPTCSAAAAWRSSTTTTTLRDLRRRGPPIAAPDAPAARRPVPRRRHRDRRRRALRRRRAVPRRDHGAHRGGRHPLRRLGVHPAAGDARAAARSTGCARRRCKLAEGIGVRGLHQRAVRARPGHPLRPRGQPARVPHGAVRLQGDRRPARQGGRPDHGRRDDRRAARRGPAARRTATAAGCRPHAPISVKEAVLPFKRFRTKEGLVVDIAARPGDALDRRGHGHRRRLRPRRSPRASSAAFGGLPPPGTVFVSVADRDKRAIIFPVKRLAELGFTHRRRPRAPPRCCAATASRPRSCASTAERGAGASDRSSTSSTPARSTWSSTRPSGPSTRARRRLRDPRGDHARWTSRSSPRCSSSRRRCRPSRPCGSASSTSSSLQDHARALDLYGACPEAAGVSRTVGRRSPAERASRPAGSAPTTTSPSWRPASPSSPSPGQFVALAVGGATSANLLRRCFSIHKVSPSGTYGGTVDIVVSAARPGHRVAHRAARPRPGRRRRSARPAVPAADRAGRLRPRRRRLRQRTAVLARRGAARARLPRRDGARRGHRGPAVRRRRGPPQLPTASRSRPTTAPPGTEGWVTDVLRRGHRPHRRRRRLRLRTDGDAPLGHRGRAARTAPWPRCAVEESMACGVGVCMTCVMPVVGQRRRDPDGALLRRGARSSAATGCAGTPSATASAGCPTTPSAAPRAWVATDGCDHRVDLRRRVRSHPAEPADDGLRLRGQRPGAAPLLRRAPSSAPSSPSR